jgi:hypothetical protein
MSLFELSHVDKCDVLLVLRDDQRIALGRSLEQKVLRHPAFVVEDALKDGLLNLAEIQANPLTEGGEPFFSRRNRDTVNEEWGFRAICC